MYRQYGKDYVALEDVAHQAHKGIWSGSFEIPSDWRKDQKLEKLSAQRGKTLQPSGIDPFEFCSKYVCIDDTCIQSNPRAHCKADHFVICHGYGGRDRCCSNQHPASRHLCACHDLSSVEKQNIIYYCVAYSGKVWSTRRGGCADAANSVLAALPSPATTSSSSASSSGAPSNGCNIKGNINAKGEKIYHMPGGRFYDSTKIDLPDGERWFCNERQAKDAGWRASSQ